MFSKQRKEKKKRNEGKGKGKGDRRLRSGRLADEAEERWLDEMR